MFAHFASAHTAAGENWKAPILFWKGGLFSQIGAAVPPFRSAVVTLRATAWRFLEEGPGRLAGCQADGNAFFGLSFVICAMDGYPRLACNTGDDEFGGLFPSVAARLWHSIF